MNARQMRKPNIFGILLSIPLLLALFLLPIHAQDNAIITIELNRTLDCSGCTATTIPGNTTVTILLSTNANGTVSDLVPADFAIVNEIAVSTMSSHDSATLVSFPAAAGRYAVRSPAVSSPATFTFFTIVNDTFIGPVWFNVSIIVLPLPETIELEGDDAPMELQPETNESSSSRQESSGPGSPLAGIDLRDVTGGILPNNTAITHQDNHTVQWTLETVGGSATDTWRVAFYSSGTEITNVCGSNRFYLAHPKFVTFSGNCTTYCVVHTDNSRINITAVPPNTQNLIINATFFTCQNTTVNSTIDLRVITQTGTNTFDDSLNVTLTANNKPSVTTATLLTAFPVTSEDVLCTNGTVSDPENHQTTLHYNWLRNGTSITVLSLPFDNTSDQFFEDVSGFGQKAKIGTTASEEGTTDVYPVRIGQGQVGFAIDTNGSRVVNITDADSLDFGSNDFALEFWMKRTAISGSNQVVMDKKNGQGSGSTGYGIVINTVNNVNFAINDGSGADVNTISNTTITDTTIFHHIVAQRDGNSLELWQDGKLVANQSDTESGLSNNVDLILGAAYNEATLSASLYASVILDELIIYNTTLDEQMITKHNSSNYTVLTSAMTENTQNWSCEITPFDIYGEKGSTVASSNVTIGSCNVSFTMSAPLQNGIAFGNVGHLTGNQSAQQNSLYNITDASTAGCSTVNVSIRATGDLTAGGNIIGIGNVTVNSSTADANTITLSTTFQRIRQAVPANTNNITDFRFWLAVPSNQLTSTYTGTIEITVEQE